MRYAIERMLVVEGDFSVETRRRLEEACRGKVIFVSNASAFFSLPGGNLEDEVGRAGKDGAD